LVLAIISASALTASAIKREGTSSFESSIYFLFFAKERRHVVCVTKKRHAEYMFVLERRVLKN
jgi:hypothetical protein